MNSYNWFKEAIERKPLFRHSSSHVKTKINNCLSLKQKQKKKKEMNFKIDCLTNEFTDNKKTSLLDYF